MSGTNVSLLTWINSNNVLDLAKVLLVSKKMIINSSNQQIVNPLLNMLSNELDAYRYGSPNEKIFLFKTDLFEQNIISLINCVKEIVSLLTPEIQELLQTFHSELY